MSPRMTTCSRRRSSSITSRTPTACRRSVRPLVESHGLTLIGVEAVTDEDQPPFIDVTVLGTVRALRSLSAEWDHTPDVLKRGAVDTKGYERFESTLT